MTDYQTLAAERERETKVTDLAFKRGRNSQYAMVKVTERRYMIVTIGVSANRLDLEDGPAMIGYLTAHPLKWGEFDWQSEHPEEIVKGDHSTIRAVLLQLRRDEDQRRYGNTPEQAVDAGEA